MTGDPVLITGGAGFIGSNLADRLAREGRRVRVFDALSRPGVERNLEWLCQRHGDLIEPVIGDIRDGAAVGRAARRVAAAFHFAAQVAVTSSLEDPRADLEINVLGSFNLLEALRAGAPGAAAIFASTNKVYGDLAQLTMTTRSDGFWPADSEIAAHGVPDAQPLEFHTPYGCSKGAADQYFLDYARSYAMPAAVLRMSCIYGQRQMGTEDQGWVAHFLIAALNDQPITIFGNGLQVRDVCDVADTCDAYLAALARIDTIAGRAFNWGGGPDNAVSLLTLIAELETIIGRKLEVRFAPWRQGDQRWFVADTRGADAALELAPRTPWKDGLRRLARWLQDERAPHAKTPAPLQPPLQAAAL